MLKDDIARLEKEVEEGAELIRTITKQVRKKRQKLKRLKANLQYVLEQNARVGNI